MQPVEKPLVLWRCRTSAKEKKAVAAEQPVKFTSRAVRLHSPERVSKVGEQPGLRLRAAMDADGGRDSNTSEGSIMLW